MTVTRAPLHVTTDEPRARTLAQYLTEMLGHELTYIEFRPGVFHVVPGPAFEEAYYTHWLDYYKGGTRMFTVLHPEI